MYKLFHGSGQLNQKHRFFMNLGLQDYGMSNFTGKKGQQYWIIHRRAGDSLLKSHNSFSWGNRKVSLLENRTMIEKKWVSGKRGELKIIPL